MNGQRIHEEPLRAMLGLRWDAGESAWIKVETWLPPTESSG